MRAYEIVETIRYTVEAESAEAALEKFLEVGPDFKEFAGEVEDRTVHPEE